MSPYKKSKTAVEIKKNADVKGQTEFKKMLSLLNSEEKNEYKRYLQTLFYRQDNT